MGSVSKTGCPALSGSTTVCGIFAHPIGHTMSPYMQTRAMMEMGFDGVYVPFHVLPDKLAQAVQGLRAMHIRGVNVTVPHKQAVMQYLDDISDAARSVGAVNTIVNDDGRLFGDNTDVPGFLDGLRAETALEQFPERVCVLGAGGAARSITYACGMQPETTEIFIINRTFEKAQSLADEFTEITKKQVRALPAEQSAFAEILPTCGLVVNTTILGIHEGDPSPVPDASLFHAGQVVNEINAVPFESQLLIDAARAGATTVNGLPMLAYQGARSLSMWTRRDAPADFMLTIVQEQMTARTLNGDS